MSLSEIQQEIVDTTGNMIVSASAGTGKTHTMVAKIAKEIEDNHTHKVIAAITFTIKAAKEYLLNTDMKTYEISEAIGVDDAGYFSKMFKKITGVSPKEFRKQGKDEKNY